MRTLEDLRSQLEAIVRIAQKYGVRNIRIFGSVARGEAGADSDVDVLVDFEPRRSLLDLVGFEQDLAEFLGCRVDVVSERGISPYLEARILQEAVSL